MNPPTPIFDHEKLLAYQRSIQFVAWASPLLLIGLVRSLAPERLEEETAEYRVGREG